MIKQKEEEVAINREAFLDFNACCIQAEQDYRQAMKRVDRTIMECVPDATVENLKKNCGLSFDEHTGISVIDYKGKPIVRFGFRASLTDIEEFFIEKVGPIDASD
jgi:hypothetical protein